MPMWNTDYTSQPPLQVLILSPLPPRWWEGMSGEGMKESYILLQGQNKRADRRRQPLLAYKRWVQREMTRWVDAYCKG